ncbi:MAG: glycoside hydrolase family 3 protein [Actinomycetota bacterium]|nr:glycoside hydrolase family 3 protein [Actinomycetota bacterium]MDQ2955483.1 glycoside hydrolase family 3 protein [Actinomycetota bacterium]
MNDDAEVRRLALACFLPGFVGETPPNWLLQGLSDGLGGVILFGSNLGDGSEVAALTGRLRAAAGRDLVFGLDEEGGDVTRLDTVRGSAVPGAAALGWLDDEAATEEVYASIGSRLAEAGVTLNLAPVADANVDPRNPVIGVRSFSSEPAVAARQVAAAVRGTQRAGVAACAKHFPGHGATSADSHHEVATVDRPRSELEAVEFAPFRAAIAAGSRAVMTGHLLVPALDGEISTVSGAVTTGLLRDTLGFTGTIVTDALEMAAISQTVGMVEGFVAALIAGADAIETGALDYPELLEQIPDAVLAAVRSGRLSVERLVDAAGRTALLAAGGNPAAGYQRAVVEQAAGRCVEVVGQLPRLSRPLVVECRTSNGMASGALPWSVADRIAERVPDTEVLIVDSAVEVAEVRAAAQGRSLVAVVRDPGRNEWQQPVIIAAAAHQAERADAVLVEVGWPAGLPEVAESLPLIRTRGIAPGLLSAAAGLLAGLSPDAA